MKKYTVIAITTACVITLASCKKDRTCTCTRSTNGGPSTTTVNVVKKTTKKAAAAGACASYTDTYTSGGTTNVETETCTFK